MKEKLMKKGFAMLLCMFLVLSFASDGRAAARAACNHVASSGFITIQEPSCTTYGTMARTCIKCGTVLETRSIAPLGHSWIVATDGSKICLRCHAPG